jgi:hypothetical protein
LRQQKYRQNPDAVFASGFLFCRADKKSGRTEKSVRPLYSGLPPVEGKKARRSKGSKRRREEKKP